MQRAMIVYSTINGQSEKVAGYMAGRLRALGIDAQACSVNSGHRLPPLADLDAIILGGSVHLGRYPADLEAYIKTHLSTLQTHPNTAFYSVSGSASRGYALDEVQALAATWLKSLAWQPRHIAHIGGAVKYPRYGLVTRWIMRRIATRKGEGTDTHHEYEYTDWDAVDAFADALTPR